MFGSSWQGVACIQGLRQGEDVDDPRDSESYARHPVAPSPGVSVPSNESTDNCRDVSTIGDTSRTLARRMSRVTLIEENSQYDIDAHESALRLC